MLGRRELVAAAVAALMAGLAVVVLFGLDDGEVVEIRVQGGVPPVPELGVISETSTTSAPAAAHSERVVWAEKGDIWLYDAKTDKRRALTTDGTGHHDFKPRFRDGSRVTYLTSHEEFGPDPTLVEFDLASGQRRMLQQLPGYIRAYDWNPDGVRLAYYNVLSDDGKTELHITGAGPAHLRRFAAIEGRGGFINWDETRIEWSPNGERLLLVDTALDTAVGPSFEKTLYVLNADGTDAIAPGVGTWARWAADGRTIYCLCASLPSREDCQWQAIDLANGVRTPLLIPSGSRPSLAPDGRLLAYDDGEDTPSVYVLDPHKPGSRPRFLARSAIAPVWLSPTRLAFTNTRPCPRSELDCIAGGHGSMFESAGTASAVDLTTGRRSALPPISTDGADTAP
jgi:Tol biopolymer transport system component